VYYDDIKQAATPNWTHINGGEPKFLRPEVIGAHLGWDPPPCSSASSSSWPPPGYIDTVKEIVRTAVLNAVPAVLELHQIYTPSPYYGVPFDSCDELGSDSDEADCEFGTTPAYDKDLTRTQRDHALVSSTVAPRRLQVVVAVGRLESIDVIFQSHTGCFDRIFCSNIADFVGFGFLARHFEPWLRPDTGVLVMQSQNYKSHLEAVRGTIDDEIECNPQFLKDAVLRFADLLNVAGSLSEYLENVPDYEDDAVFQAWAEFAREMVYLEFQLAEQSDADQNGSDESSSDAIAQRQSRYPPSQLRAFMHAHNQAVSCGKLTMRPLNSNLLGRSTVPHALSETVHHLTAILDEDVDADADPDANANADADADSKSKSKSKSKSMSMSRLELIRPLLEFPTPAWPFHPIISIEFTTEWTFAEQGPGGGAAAKNKKKKKRGKRRSNKKSKP
jgi:hypothetical protein